MSCERATAAPSSRLAALALAAGLAAGVAGCCGTPFEVEDMAARNLATPYNTLDYFRYALRREAWDAVYRTLSNETRAFIEEKWLGRALFGQVFARKELEDVDPHAPEAVRHMRIVELIHRAETINVVVEPVDPATGRPRRGLAIVYLFYEPYGRVEPFVLVEEAAPGGRGREWHVGIREWLREREGAPDPAPDPPLRKD